MSRFVVGTAGHIDHGKSSLIEALTGISTDRLSEEKKRGISIVSGYAFLDYQGEKISIIDVPGHERFIKNMLAGVTGIDLVLLVVAADEGVMPQTKEHFEILNLLDIHRGLIVMTKCDLVDEEMQELVELDIQELIENTPYEDFPIFRASAKTKDGIQEIREFIFAEYDQSREQEQFYPRLFIDRVFKGKGIGDIVTGTLEGADLPLESTLRLYPGKVDFKIRSMESHGESTQVAGSHSRVALVLQGDEKNQLEPGKILATKDKYHHSKNLLVRLRSIPGQEERIRSGDSYKVYFGSEEILGKLHFVEEDLYELELEKEILSFYHQKGILRQLSPVVTLGGLEVLDARPLWGKKNKLRAATYLKEDDFSTRMEYIGWKYPHGFTMEDLEREFVLSRHSLEKKLEEENISLLQLGQRYFTKSSMSRQQEELDEAMTEMMKEDPLRDYWDKEVLKSRYFKDMARDVFERMMEQGVQEESISLQGNQVKPFGYTLELSDEQKLAKERLLKLFAVKGYEIPSIQDIRKEFEQGDEELFSYLIHSGDLISLSSDIFMEKELFFCLKNDIISLGRGKGTLEIADVRDALGLSRKYIVTYLEYFDRIGVTKRMENTRILTKEYENG